MYESICYTKNYLNEVICRLDFASPAAQIGSSMPKPLYDVVKKYYPIAEPKDIIGTELQINPASGAIVNQIVSKQWIFLSRDRKNKCTISPDSIVFSIRDYNVFDDLRLALIDVLSSFFDNFPDIQGKRLGLRYVNEIDIKDHNDWIVDKFFDALSAHKSKNTTRLITQSEYAIVEKDLSVRLHYGYPNPDYPAAMKKECFVIDIDAFSTGIIYKEDLEKLINDMHFEDQKCFETMITDEMRSSMQ